MSRDRRSVAITRAILVLASVGTQTIDGAMEVEFVPVERAGSWAASDGSRKSMRANRGRDTSPELRVRSILHRRGLRYRVSARPEPRLRRTADLVFGGSRVAVFIDGCFWHGCPEHATRPVRNADWWANKLDRTVERDLETTEALQLAGWQVLRFWEHEPAEEVADAIQRIVNARSSRA